MRKPLGGQGVLVLIGSFKSDYVICFLWKVNFIYIPFYVNFMESLLSVLEVVS
jgi:hypothetical protein